MDLIEKCAQIFARLCDHEYSIVLSRRGKSVSLRLTFLPEDFHHLAGLHKLKDIYEMGRGQRDKFLSKAIGQDITDGKLMVSEYYDKVFERQLCLLELENILESQSLYFRFNENTTWSKIEADYIVEYSTDERTVYLFLAKRDDGSYSCRSIFPKATKDYTVNQAKLTLLKVEKVHIPTGVKFTYYDREAQKERDKVNVGKQK